MKQYDKPQDCIDLCDIVRIGTNKWRMQKHDIVY